MLTLILSAEDTSGTLGQYGLKRYIRTSQAKQDLQLSGK